MKKLIYTVFIAVLLSSCGTLEEAKDLTHDEKVQHGLKSFTNKNYREAFRAFKSAYVNAPDSTEILQWIGWAAFKSNEVDTALFYFELALDEAEATQDMYAGYAFALNVKAQMGGEIANMPIQISFASDDIAKGSVSIQSMYSLSTYYVEEALDYGDWQFPYGLNLNENHLFYIASHNSYLDGYFSDAFYYLRDIRGNFNLTSSINTQAGQAELALLLEQTLQEL
jgi:hypothetical protein